MEDREALRLLRDGKAEASQTIRTEYGWEHDNGSPTASRNGLADAAVADMGRHGPDRVAVLCVSHTDAEELADRIRHRLTSDGVISGPALEGLGWAGPREFQEGDRVCSTPATPAGTAGSSTAPPPPSTPSNAPA